MKKALILLIFAFILGICGAIFLRFDGENRPQISDDANLSCDLNKNPCEMSGVKFSLNSYPIEAMKPFELRISGLKGEFEDLNLRIYGLNMDMGTILSHFEKKGEIYETRAVVSVCVVKRMLYRAEIYDGKKPLGIFADFEMK